MFRRGTDRGRSSPESVFTELRRQVLTLEPSTVGLGPTSPRPGVWGGLMDMGYEGRRWSTLPTAGEAPDLPDPGDIVIRSLLFDGQQRAVVVPEADLGYGRHAAAPLFHAAPDVITQMRLLQEGDPQQ